MRTGIFIFLFIFVSGCAATVPLPGDTQTSKRDGMELVFIPAGEFIMGSEANNMDADRDETPSHIVFIDSFWMDKTEVTNAMYGQCISTGACAPPAQTKFHTMPEYSNHPVLGVSWEQASAYCHWAGRRLPTEAEWEKAARGTDGRIYPWGNENPSPRLVNFDHNINETLPVGSFSQGASYYGVLDMAGNAWEWVADGYSAEYYAVTPVNNPLNPLPANQRVLRGGN